MGLRYNICKRTADLLKAQLKTRFYTERKIKSPPVEYGAVFIPEWPVSETDMDGTLTYDAELVVEVFTEETYHTDRRLDEFSEQIKKTLLNYPTLNGMVSMLKYTGGRLGEMDDASPPSVVLTFTIQYEEDPDHV